MDDFVEFTFEVLQMPARPTWKGYLKLSLVSVPVKAFTVSDSSQSDIRLNQLHAECHRRIQYKKTCPEHGEVPNDEIISGYQIGEDQYVPIDKEELAAIRTKSDQSIDIATFIGDDQLDDRYLTERSYYLVPDDKVAQKPYALIRETLAKEKLRAIAEVILSQREQHVVIRALGELLIMTVLQRQQELKSANDFEQEVDNPEVTEQELMLTKQLVTGLTQKDWDFGNYQDTYQQRLSQLIETKIEGKELIKPPETEAPNIINLMDALKASIEQIPVPQQDKGLSTGKESKASRGSKPSGKVKPAKKMAASKPASESRRKSSKRKTG